MPGHGISNSPFLKEKITEGGCVAPVIVISPLITGDLQQGNILSVTSGTWTGTGPLNYTYQWKRNTISIGGATTNTYSITANDLAKNITCEVTAHSPCGAAPSTQISNVVVPEYAPEVLLLLTNAGISDQTIKDALQFRLMSFKGIETSFNPTALNIFVKSRADYPIVGGTVDTTKYNLFDANNLSIIWNGSPTFTNDEVAGNAINAYGEVPVSPNDLGQNSGGFGIYVQSGSIQYPAILGVYDSPTNVFDLYPKYIDNNLYTGINDAESGFGNGAVNGSFVVTRQDSSSLNLFDPSGTKYALVKSSVTPSSKHIAVLAYNANGSILGYSTWGISGLTLFDTSLTDTESLVYQAIDIEFQTRLSRNV